MLERVTFSHGTFLYLCVARRELITGPRRADARYSRRRHGRLCRAKAKAAYDANFARTMNGGMADYERLVSAMKVRADERPPFYFIRHCTHTRHFTQATSFPKAVHVYQAVSRTYKYKVPRERAECVFRYKNIPSKKDEIFSSIQGREVLEIGMGTGPNMRYYKGLDVVGLEPNEEMSVYSKQVCSTQSATSHL